VKKSPSKLKQLILDVSESLNLNKFPNLHMKSWRIILPLSFLFFFAVKAANQDSIFGCIYTCTRLGTATDTSSVCSATHVTIDL